MKSLQKLIIRRVPVDLGTISSPRIRGQPLCFWGFKCNRCPLPLRKLFTPSSLSFFGRLPLQGKPKPLRIRFRIRESLNNWILGRHCFRKILPQMYFLGCFLSKKKVPSTEKGQERRCCISWSRWWRRDCFFSVALLTLCFGQSEQWEKVTRPFSSWCLRRTKMWIQSEWRQCH